MKNLFRIVHVIIVAKFVLTGNDIYDYILGGIIAFISYIYAFRITRNLASAANYNDIVMSLFHWTFRTVISILMILITRYVYLMLVASTTYVGVNNPEIVSIVTCSIGWLSLAEVLKYKTNLRKKYW